MPVSTLLKIRASDPILCFSISFARDKAKLIKQLIPMVRQSEREREWMYTHRLPRGRGLAFRDRLGGGGYKRKNKRGAACLSWKSAWLFRRFSICGSVKGMQNVTPGAAPFRAVPLRRAKYVSSHTCQLRSRSVRKKRACIMVQSKINRSQSDPVWSIRSKTWFLRFPGYHSAVSGWDRAWVSTK